MKARIKNVQFLVFIVVSLSISTFEVPQNYRSREMFAKLDNKPHAMEELGANLEGNLKLWGLKRLDLHD
ncbi:MAG: hypothetical protein M3R69_16120 [Acidobacteriota bacterium]|nr:hypothetical protein [Acidobacteriota bacterium]